MGMVVQFPARRHVRASDGSSAGSRACIVASTSNVIPMTPRSAARPTISDQNSEGIFPRARQLLTTGAFSESALANSEVPPKSWISESGDMQQSIFTFCEYVKVHAKGIAARLPVTHPLAMAKRYAEIGKRLTVLRAVLGISQAEICRQIKCGTNRWNQYEKGDRQITLTVANRLCDGYGASLDWIYRGDPRALTGQLQQLILKTA